MNNITWWHLRSVGNLWVLKVSYVALALIPLLTSHNRVSQWLGFEVWSLGVVYFANLFLALANLIYDIACPVVVQRFASPNDLYLEMLKIAKLSLQLYPDDNFNASLSHSRDKYVTDSKSTPFLRLICFSCYLAAGGLFMIFFAYRSYIVIAALCESYVK
jgi:hypothetical protein